MATQRIKLDLIDHEDLSTQMRECTDDDLVADYAKAMRNGQKFDPIQIMSKGDERYVVIDGHHRIRAHYKAKPKARNIDAVVLPLTDGVTPKRSAIDAALTVNEKHGKRLTNADKRNKCRRVWLLDVDSWEQGDREVGRIAGVDHKTASSVRKELVKDRRIPIRDGDLYGELKPSWLPIAYISEWNVQDSFCDTEQSEVFHLAKKIEPICNGDADAWAWNEERGSITHWGIEAGITHSVPLEENHALLKGHMPIMCVIYELEGDLDEKNKKEAIAVLYASGDASYRSIAREILHGDMKDKYKDALRELLKEAQEADEDIIDENSDF